MLCHHKSFRLALIDVPSNSAVSNTVFYVLPLQQIESILKKQLHGSQWQLKVFDFGEKNRAPPAKDGANGLGR